MTNQRLERWLVMGLAVALLTGRADGQQKPADNPPEKKADVRSPRGDGKGPRDDGPRGDPNQRRPGEPGDPAGRPADEFRPFDRPSPEVPRRPGGRGPEGPGLYG